jgi:hypothetical protein
MCLSYRTIFRGSCDKRRLLKCEFKIIYKGLKFIHFFQVHQEVVVFLVIFIVCILLCVVILNGYLLHCSVRTHMNVRPKTLLCRR